MKRNLRDGGSPSYSVSSVSRLPALAAFVVLALMTFGMASPAHAAGTFKLKSTEVQEVSGAWHIFVTIELPKPPSMPHVPLKFLFTKTSVYERALIDNHKDPVLNRMALSNQNPSVESLDVDFADGRGKIFKSTRFDFGLTRTRGYEAGEYKVQVRTSDGTDVGQSANLVLKGDNPVVDRRSITFNAKEPGIKKVDTGLDGGSTRPKADEDVPAAANQDVAATGTAPPFIAPEAFNKTPEEEIKERPKGCGCDVPGVSRAGGAGGWRGSLAQVSLASLAALAVVGARRRRRGDLR